MIRPLEIADAKAYRTLRLDALAGAPTAFGADLATEDEMSTHQFAQRLADGRTFGAFAGTELVGTAAFYTESGPKIRHIGWLVGVWVDPNHRGQGLAKALVAHVVNAAKRQGVVVLRLGVNATNTAAQAVYRAAGFQKFAVERAAIFHDGVYHDEFMMEQFLRPTDDANR